MSPEEGAIFSGLVTKTIPVDAIVTVFRGLLIKSWKTIIDGFIDAKN